MSSITGLLTLLERYFDAVPRADARAEDHGPLTLFVRDAAGYPYYARPRFGQDAVTPRDVALVCARQRELGVPETFEYVRETTPAMDRAARSTGLLVTEHPLLVQSLPAGREGLEGSKDSQGASEGSAGPVALTVRMLAADAPDRDLAIAHAVARLGFSTPGTGGGPLGPDAVAEALEEVPIAQVGSIRHRLSSGLTATAVAELDGAPVGVGSHQPIGEVSEIVGVAVLPAARRRGVGAALTRTLTGDALARGCRTVCLSAGDDDVARVYERVGFRRVATACVGYAG
ncbi:MAG TPA: GNAT family N-acetyltransferase [Mycobacteriales bacterium]|nr:GNAT family N-acetyltransferase [Mycobacteriales bacterium]